MTGKVIRLLTKEERKAVESAQTMTPLTLLMVVDTVKAEARHEGAADALHAAANEFEFAISYPRIDRRSVVDILRDRAAALRREPIP